MNSVLVFLIFLFSPGPLKRLTHRDWPGGMGPSTQAVVAKYRFPLEGIRASQSHD